MKDILLLHGALGSASQLNSLATALKDDFNVRTLNFSGHGGDDLPDEDFSIRLFAEEVLSYLEEHKLSSVNIFGYSMGGYVALYLAAQHPDKIQHLITLGTKFDWNPETANREASYLNADDMELKIPKYAEQLKQRHGEKNWKQVLQKTASLMQSMPVQSLTGEQLSNITSKCLLMVGDSDKMVSIRETENTFKEINGSACCVLPGTVHILEKVDLNLLKFFLNRFINQKA